MTTSLQELPRVTAAQRDAILAAPRTPDAHRALMADLAAMNAVQSGGAPVRDVLPASVSVVTWNLERCLFPVESAAHIAGVAPDIVLLSEVDHGMARTGQRHTTEEMARALGMTYVFGVEFHELDLGSPTEREFCTDAHNDRGWHGNAILSAAPPARVELLRLDDHGHWFSEEFGADPGQPRVGGRMALLAEIPTEAGPFCVVSTHLESNAGAAHRAAQFDMILDAVDRFAPGMPALVGGDLNTGNNVPEDQDWTSEGLFAAAEARGFDWSFTPAGMTTRPSLITRHPARQMKLDWFCGRGLIGEESRLIPSLKADGTPLSDHDAVWCRVHPERR